MAMLARPSPCTRHPHAPSQIDDAAKGAWVEVQKKAFTRWANSHLKQKGCPEIGDLFTDTSDGVCVCMCGWLACCDV